MRAICPVTHAPCQAGCALAYCAEDALAKHFDYARLQEHYETARGMLLAAERDAHVRGIALWLAIGVMLIEAALLAWLL